MMPQATQLPRTSGLFKNVRLLRKKSAPGSATARDKWLVQEKVRFLRKSSSPGSEAARDKWLLQKQSDLKSSAPGSPPTRPPAFRGLRPLDPQKALRALGCSGCSLSRDRTPGPGQNFFPEIRLFLKNPLVRGSFAAWGRTFSQKMTFF